MRSEGLKLEPGRIMHLAAQLHQQVDLARLVDVCVEAASGDDRVGLAALAETLSTEHARVRADISSSPNSPNVGATTSGARNASNGSDEKSPINGTCIIPRMPKHVELGARMERYTTHHMVLRSNAARGACREPKATEGDMPSSAYASWSAMARNVSMCFDLLCMPWASPKRATWDVGSPQAKGLGKPSAMLPVASMALAAGQTMR